MSPVQAGCIEPVFYIFLIA